MASVRASRAAGLLAAAMGLAAGWSLAQAPAPGERLPEGAHVVVPSAPEDFIRRGEPKFYQEYLVTSPGVRPSYVPGYVPKVSPRFLNPRQRPARGTAEWYMSNRPEFQDLPGGHFGSTTGFQKTGVTADSPVGDYHLGRSGITKVLQFGYPEGQRVIEPVIVPVDARSEKAGWYIDAGRPTEIDLGVSDSFPEKRGQRASRSSGLATRSSQLANPNSDCSPTGLADGHPNTVRWSRSQPTGVQRLVGRQ